MSAHHTITQLLPQLRDEAQRPIQRARLQEPGHMTECLVVVVTGAEACAEVAAMLDGVEERWHDQLGFGADEARSMELTLEQRMDVERPFQAIR